MDGDDGYNYREIGHAVNVQIFNHVTSKQCEAFMSASLLVLVF